MSALERLPVLLWVRLRPPQGWLLFALLVALALTVAGSVVDAGWTSEIAVVWPAAVTGFALGVLLALRRTRPLIAFSLIAGYLFAVTFAALSSLLPWQILNRPGEMPLWFDARRDMWLLLDRAGGWLLAVSRGGSSRETVAFTFALAMLVGLLPALLAWSVYRQRRPIPALGIVGLALALNAYFGSGGRQAWIVAVYVSLAALLIAAVHSRHLQERWDRQGTDYYSLLHVELLLVASGAAVGLMMLAMLLPAVRIAPIADAFRSLGPVQQAEQALDRIFGGVRTPFREVPVGGFGPGVLPRSFLLGASPELSETVVMTATLSGTPGNHWRALSYDIYTGSGWARSDEREERTAAGELLPIPQFASESVITQTVHWLIDERTARYTMGAPWRFSEEVVSVWRGLDDLVIVRGQASAYTARSRLSAATSADLRRVQLSDIPPALAARYTNLPDVPARVHELAREITAGAVTPYDRALAIERFLRQYPYSLEVPPPPADRDPVDFFLFELQTGYCDYYASAMVVLARSVGLPARLAIGYLAHRPAENGVYTMRHMDAHSWAEIYFPGHGWIEFEPTAPFPVAARDPALSAPEESSPEFATPAALPLPPPQAAQRPSPLWGLFLLAALLVAGWFAVRRLRSAGAPPRDEAVVAFQRLQEAAGGLGLDPAPDDTPAEFEQMLLAGLDSLARPESRPRVPPINASPIQRIVDTFTVLQYGRKKPGRRAHVEAWQAWESIRRPMWLAGLLLRLARRFRRQGRI